jgi:hypothetical protein
MVPLIPNLVNVHSCLGGFLLVDVLSNVHSCLGGSHSPFWFIHFFFCYTTIHNKLDRQSFFVDVLSNVTKSHKGFEVKLKSNVLSN